MRSRLETHTLVSNRKACMRVIVAMTFFASCRIGVQIFAFYFQAASKNALYLGTMAYWAEKTLQR